MIQIDCYIERVYIYDMRNYDFHFSIKQSKVGESTNDDSWLRSETEKICLSFWRVYEFSESCKEKLRWLIYPIKQKRLGEVNWQINY